MSNQPLRHPVSGSLDFGTIPETQNRGIRIPTGSIRLPKGKHWGVNGGFGARHIWQEHQSEMAQAGYHSYEDVPNYVASIIRTGTPLFFEGNNMRNTRLMAVRSSTGTAILELREQRNETIWAVVTAYSGTKPHGTRVGTVR